MLGRLFAVARRGSHKTTPSHALCSSSGVSCMCYSDVGLTSSVMIKTAGRSVPAQSCSPSAKELLFTDDTALANDRTNTICSDTMSFIPAISSDCDNWCVGAGSRGFDFAVRVWTPAGFLDASKILRTLTFLSLSGCHLHPSRVWHRPSSR